MKGFEEQENGEKGHKFGRKVVSASNRIKVKRVILVNEVHEKLT